MYEISCEMCMDLMPLVRDGVASGDSRASVEAHIAACEACRAAYAGEIPPEPDADKAIRKTIKRMQAVSAAVLAVLVIWAVVTMSMFFGELAIIYAMLCLLTFAALRGAFRKGKKLPAKIGAVVLAAVIVVVGDMMAGNPVSWLLAKNAVEDYLEETYAGTDYTAERVTHNFMNGDYYAPITSGSSMDTHFTVYIDKWGRVKYDTYDSVTDGWKTAERLSTESREFSDPVTDALERMYDANICYLRIEFTTREAEGDGIPDYAIFVEDLVLDGVYDPYELGAQAGTLVLYMRDDVVSAERAAEILLEVKAYLDEAGIGFRGVNLMLQYPVPEDGSEAPEGLVWIENFLYEDIYEEGLAERVEQANADRIAYYAALDAQ